MTEPTVTGRHAIVGGVRCHYLEAGSGPPLVLLHGTAIDSAALSYGPSLPRLAERHRVIALDWPGYGRSEAPPAAPAMTDLLGLLEAFLDELGLEEAHLAGFSMGGAVALGFALRSPGRVRSLALVGSYGFDKRAPLPLLPYLALKAPWLSPTATWTLRRSRRLVKAVLHRLVFADGKLVTDELVSAVHERLREPLAERSFVAWLKGEMRPFGLGTSYEAQLGEVSVPTLILHGRADRVVPWRKARRASDRIPGARLVTVRGCGHWVPREAQDVFVEEVSRHVSGGGDRP